ncbi:MAG TPA: hypothetical protein EYO17_03955 [Dehalococcoidia bacterium]|nr:hypothetical protein [Dehalococcoidia bacterium]
MAVCWLFPGKTVGIDCPCLDCNEPIRIQMLDGEVLSSDPSTIVGHRNLSAAAAPDARQR